MAITASNIHDGELINPLDDRYVPVYATISDLPEVTVENNDELAVVQQGAGVYKVENGAWVLQGQLAGGGGGGGNMFTALYDTNSDGRVDAADHATTATSATTAATAASAEAADEVSGVGESAPASYYGKDVFGIVGFHTTEKLSLKSSDPTANDDHTQGYIPSHLWWNSADEKLWVMISTDVQNAVWKEVGSAAGVVGLTNPLVESLNASGKLIYSASFAGFRDRYYDLSEDASNLIDSGTANLVATYNAYYYPGLDSALEIVLPDPTSGASNDALFGIISIELASGGSVTLAQDEDAPWGWEKADLDEDSPTLPSAEGTVFRLRYSWDPITEQYAVSLSYLSSTPVPSGAVEIVPGSVSVSNLSYANKDTHSHTHTLVSDSQDGTKYLIVLFAADGNAAPSQIPNDLVPITTPPSGSGTQVQGLWYYYKFDNDDISAGQVVLSFVKSNEIGQILAFEVTGANSSNPVGGTAFDRSSSQSRTSIGPVALTPGDDGSLMVASLTCDVKGTNPTISLATANGFSSIGSFDARDNDDVGFLVAARAADVSGGYESPVFSRTPGDSYSQLEAFWLVPE